VQEKKEEKKLKLDHHWMATWETCQIPTGYSANLAITLSFILNFFSSFEKLSFKNNYDEIKIAIINFTFNSFKTIFVIKQEHYVHELDYRD